MKQRFETKDQNQTKLDRRLLEEVGARGVVKGGRSKPRLDEIKDLLSLGAQPDHWVQDEYGDDEYYNAIISAVHQESSQAITIAKLLILKFSTFGNKDRGRDWESPLGFSFLFGRHEMWKMILQTKTAINPIYSFLTKFDESKAEKLQVLKTIDKFYSLSKVIQSDLEQIRSDRIFNNTIVRQNLAVLVDFCRIKGTDYLFKIFGKSYSIKSALGWRFKKQYHFKWIAQEMLERNFRAGKCSIQNMGTHFEVNVIVRLSKPYRFFQILSKFSLFRIVSIRKKGAASCCDILNTFNFNSWKFMEIHIILYINSKTKFLTKTSNGWFDSTTDAAIKSFCKKHCFSMLL